MGRNLIKRIIGIKNTGVLNKLEITKLILYIIDIVLFTEIKKIFCRKQEKRQRP